MRAFISRRALLAGTAGLAAGALAGRSRAAEDQSADQMLQELIQENQESSLDAGFDNASRQWPAGYNHGHRADTAADELSGIDAAGRHQ